MTWKSFTLIATAGKQNIGSNEVSIETRKICKEKANRHSVIR